MKRSTITLAAALMLTAAALKFAFPLGRTVPVYSSSNTPATAAAVQAKPETTDTASSYTVVTINAAEFLGGERASRETVSLPAAVEDAVETFLAEQSPYEDLAVPANVSYDVDLPSFDFVKPVNAEVSSPFGYRVHPLENLTKFHYGTDLAAQSGDDVLSFASGTVSEVGEDPDNGKYIRIDHPDGFSSSYAHCGTIYVFQGQAVGKGEKIALVGATGKATGPHLHFELRHNGVYLNPEFFMAAI